MFTLNLKTTLFDTCGFNDEPKWPYWYSDELKLANHTNSKNHRWNHNFNVTPGLLVKYFNGIKQEIPIKERFLLVERFVISRDGHNILIVGIKFDTSKVSTEGTIYTQEGLFLYQIDKDDITQVKLRQSILYAQKHLTPEKHEVQEKLIVDLRDNEIDDSALSEYPKESYENEQRKFYSQLTKDDYQDDLDPQPSDDEDDVFSRS